MEDNLKQQKVLVAMSGGVDSAAACIILQRQGYLIEGATYILTEQMREASKSAAQICERIGIKHHEVEMTELFEEKVIKYFVESYIKGETPNPCVRCNQEIKFKAFMEYAEQNGFDLIATGHYCRVISDSAGVHLLKGNATKDQTYFLSRVSPEALKKAIFPIGLMKKEEVRRIVQEIDITCSQIKDSQDICFNENGEYISTVRKHTDEETWKRVTTRGDFVISREGRVPAQHKGYINYTIGQRRGLNVSYTEPLYVVGLDVQTNEVYLGSDRDLFGTEVWCGPINFINFDSYERAVLTGKLSAKIRFSKLNTKVAEVIRIGDNNCVVFEEPVRASTPGQTIAFYNEDECVGGAQIIGNDFDI